MQLGDLVCTCEKQACTCIDKGESNAVWSCLYRMYHGLLALPVLSLMGAVLLLGGRFEGDTYRLRQILQDLECSSNLINITRHLSEETALSHVFWFNQSEGARATLHDHVTVTDQLLLNASQWLPGACVTSLGLRGDDSEGLFQRFLSARSGVEYNETPLALSRRLFDEFVLSVADCPLADVTDNSLLRKELKTELAYQHLLAASVKVQHVSVRHRYECALTPAHVSLDTSQLTRSRTHITLVRFLETRELSRFAETVNGLMLMFESESDAVCSEDALAEMERLVAESVRDALRAQSVLRRDAQTLLAFSEVDLFTRSFLIIATVVALCVALFVFGRASRRSREIARVANVVSSYADSQVMKKDNVLELCLPRSAIRPSMGIFLGLQCAAEENTKVSAAVLAFEVPRLSAMLQDGGDSSVALWAMTHILSLVEEKAYKHRTFLLQQQAACCVLASVSTNTHWNNASLWSVADMALDLMTSLIDVELPLTSHGQLRPRFGIHTGTALGFAYGLGPVRYCLAGDLAAVAMTCQRLSEPSCVRLSWETHCALTQLDQYICLEVESTEEENGCPEKRPAYYLAGKRSGSNNTHSAHTAHKHPAPAFYQYV